MASLSVSGPSEAVVKMGEGSSQMGDKLKVLFSRLFRRKAGYSYDTALEGTAPEDRYHLVYICMLMTGVGFLIPWSCYIGAVDYFFFYYLRDFPSVSVVLPISYLVITFLASTLNLVLVRVVSVHPRITFGYVMFTISLLLIPLLDIGIHNCTIPTSVSFYLTVVFFGLVGLGSGVQQSSLYGLASMLPKRYVQAVMAGESVAGVLEITLRIITKGTVKSVRTGAFLFFGLSLAIILLCVFCHWYLRRNKMVIYYIRQCQAGVKLVERSRTHGNESTGEEEEEEEGEGDRQLLVSKSQETELDEMSGQQERRKEREEEREANGGLSDSSGSILVNHSAVKSRELRNMNKLQRSLRVYMGVVSQIWPLIGAVFTGYFVTLFLFPGLVAEVQNCTLGTWTPILLIAIFNYTDFIAKYLALLPIRWSPKMLLVGSAARILLIPLIVMCVAPSPSAPVFGEDTVVYLAGAFVLVLGLSNGYFGSLPLITAPKHVKDDRDKELAGIIMTWALLSGLLVGAVAAYALTPLTTLQEQVLCTNSTTTEYFSRCGHENDTNIIT